ncbi:hypothetical protein [Aestuariispira ectoiniformans]|uniref:hypothetical protein n=1 Tax=Aestuariispira ectoiniformans TaxID=2775080 RepID=UPI00223C03CA|nr:hypothetical protein [Aestuariispira ectoiniformans]
MFAFRNLVVAAGLMAAGLAGGFSSPAMARAGTGIPVIVMGEDSDPASVKRSSDIYKRVLAALKGSMQRYDFRMVDEEFLAADLGWKVRDRRPKVELVQAAKLANSAGRGNLRSRAMVLFRIHATIKNLGFSNKITTRVDGEIYDIASNTFLDTFELAPAAYPAPADCNSVCVSEVVGKKARTIAMNLGDVLGKKLAYLTEGGQQQASAGGASKYDQGLVTGYTLEMNAFDTREALTIVSVMAEEFPGYVSHDLLEKGSVVRKYEYLSRAPAVKLDEWLTILLTDMGFDMDRQISLQVSNGRIILDKIVNTDERPRSEDETARYN